MTKRCGLLVDRPEGVIVAQFCLLPLQHLYRKGTQVLSLLTRKCLPQRTDMLGPLFAGDNQPSYQTFPRRRRRTGQTCLAKCRREEGRSEERRVGKECVSTGSSRWSP